MTFIDFFSGIGGFRLGMEQAGHECLGHCEIDKYANISYAAIHQPKESEFFATDIRGIEPRDLPDADCYCGGFPCQSFSIAGKRGGFDDTRGTLFFEVMRLAKVRQPSTLFLENVVGLLNHDNGDTFEVIIRTMDELGYDAEWQVLNSATYLPHNRNRIFIIGRSRKESKQKVFPIQDYNSTPEKERTKRLECIYDGDHQSKRIYSVNGISPTLMTSSGGHLIWDTEHLRQLTPLEYWRLQGFPDCAHEAAKNAGVSDSQRYKQAGNSVTVNVIYEIAKRL